MAEWIPCSTKPPRDPEPGWAKTVLLVFADGEYNLGYYEPEDRVWCAYDGGGHYDEAVPPPTHWMALPAPPRGKSSAAKMAAEEREAWAKIDEARRERGEPPLEQPHRGGGES